MNDAGEATLYLYDVIVSDALTAEWWGGVAPQPFIETLMALDAETIHLRINSPGGDVFAARAIEQAIREHPANIIAHVDGYAASAATLVTVAADRVEMAPGAFLMVHNSWSIAVGNANDMLDMATLLEKVDGSIVQTYARRTGAAADAIKAWMDAETWFSAEEAIATKFADALMEQPAVADCWNLSAYRHPPRVERAPPIRIDEAPTPDLGELHRKLEFALQGCLSAPAPAESRPRAAFFSTTERKPRR